jgi:hypothetical protein
VVVKISCIAVNLKDGSNWSEQGPTERHMNARILCRFDGVSKFEEILHCALINSVTEFEKILHCVQDDVQGKVKKRLAKRLLQARDMFLAKRRIN